MTLNSVSFGFVWSMYKVFNWKALSPILVAGQAYDSDRAASPRSALPPCLQPLSQSWLCRSRKDPLHSKVGVA